MLIKNTLFKIACFTMLLLVVTLISACQKGSESQQRMFGEQAKIKCDKDNLELSIQRIDNNQIRLLLKDKQLILTRRIISEKGEAYGNKKWELFFSPEQLIVEHRVHDLPYDYPNCHFVE